MASNNRPVKAAKKRAAKTEKKPADTRIKKLALHPVSSTELTETEQDLLTHMEQGYQLETDPRGEPVLRNLKTDEVLRPMSANRNTVRALEERGLITPAKGRDPLTIVWHLKKKN